MAGNTALILLIVAFVLLVALLALCLRRLKSEGITVNTPDREHFKRSAEEVRRELGLKHAEAEARAAEEKVAEPEEAEPQSPDEPPADKSSSS